MIDRSVQLLRQGDNPRLVIFTNDGVAFQMIELLGHIRENYIPLMDVLDIRITQGDGLAPAPPIIDTVSIEVFLNRSPLFEEVDHVMVVWSALDNFQQ